jgi:hypothetical protein
MLSDCLRCANQGEAGKKNSETKTDYLAAEFCSASLFPSCAKYYMFAKKNFFPFPSLRSKATPSNCGNLLRASLYQAEVETLYSVAWVMTEGYGKNE